MKRKTLRLYLLLLSLGGVALAAGLAANAIFGNTLVFFYAPGELAKAEIAPDARIRIGGLVEAGSLHPGNDPAEISFRVTDLTAAIEVRYRGRSPIFSARGKAWSPKAGSIPPDFSWLRRSSPSMTKITCRPKSPRP